MCTCNGFDFRPSSIGNSTLSQFCFCYTPSTLIRTNPWVCRGICTCCYGFGPFCLSFNVIKDCLHITSLASFKIGFPKLGFFDRFSAKHRCGVFFLYSFRLVFSHIPFINKQFVKHGFWTFSRFFWSWIFN